MNVDIRPDNTAARIEQILDIGIMDRWYPVLAAPLVTDHPVAVTRLSLRLVVWRGEGGTAHVQRDLCPHRAAPLSAGFVADGRLTCAYHGVQVDGEGTIADVPALPGCPLIGRRDMVRTLPSIEVQGCIFAWFGEGPAASFGLPYEFTDPAWTGFLCTAAWDSHYRYALDNLMDPMHGSYLHANSFTLAYGSKEDTFRVRDTDTGFVIEKERQVGLNFDWTEFADTGAFWIRLDIPYPAAAGPGGHMRIVGFVAPIESGKCQVFFWRMRKVEGWQRDLWRFLYRTRLEPRHWHVLEQDRKLLELMEPGARRHEHLYQHDIGVIQLRRMLGRIARESFAPAVPA